MRSVLDSWIAILRNRSNVLLLFGLIGAAMVGCQSTSAIQNVPLSYNAIKTVIVSTLPAAVRRESSNGRTMTSGFFDPTTLKPEKPNAKIHGYAVVTVLGSSRPYNIEVKAFTEEKDKDGFEPLGENRELSKRLAERLRAALADRREDRNVIDDFRAF